MTNYDENDQNSIANFINNNLARHTQFAIGTIDDNGKPWVVCVNLTVDQKFNFIWKSQKTSEHSKYILKRPAVSICVFSETEDIGDFGYYCQAVAHEVNDEEELKKLLDIRFKQKGKPVPPIEEFLGESNTSLYYAEVSDAWVNDSRHLKVSVDLKTLSSFPNGNGI